MSLLHNETPNLESEFKVTSMIVSSRTHTGNKMSAVEICQQRIALIQAIRRVCEGGWERGRTTKIGRSLN